MNRSGFTMIELVFIIVILGILASVAVPKMAASREDAKIVSVKQDIGTITQAIPAMAMSQGASNVTAFSNAVSLNAGNWTPVDTGSLATSKKIRSNIGTGGAIGTNANTCVVIEIMTNSNGESTVAGVKIPPLAKYIRIDAKVTDSVCKKIIDTTPVVIPLTGSSVNFN
ncbi:MAG: type II secretion system protein [Wolinella sp.]